MNVRAVLYARVSGDDRESEGRNLLGQLDMCRGYAHERGYQVVAELHEDDQGASGAILDLPQLSHVRDLARARAFDVLVVREIDRLSRSLAKQLLLEDEFQRHGIRIEYVLGECPDTPEGNLMKHVKACIAEFERLKIRERIVRGCEARVKAGSFWGSRAPFGYQIVKQGDRSVLEINEAEATIVRQIFDWYTKGKRPLGTHAIRKRLWQLKVPSPVDLRPEGRRKKRGYGEWCDSTVDLILKSETYAGTWHWRKRTCSNGKRVFSQPEARIAVEVPAIVSPETWEAAVARRTESRARRRASTRSPCLLKACVSCGLCGVPVRGRRMSEGRVYYTCQARDKSLVCSHTCNLPYYRADDLEAAVWAWAKSLLLDPAALETGLAALRERSASEEAPLRERIQAIDRRLAMRRQASARLLDRYLAGTIAQERLQERKQSLGDHDKELQRERAALLARLEARSLDDSALRDLRGFAEQVIKALATGEDENLRRMVIENLDVRVSLTTQGDQKLADVRCILGSDRLVLRSAR